MGTTFNCASCGEQVMADENSLSAVCQKCGRIIALTDGTVGTSGFGNFTGPIIVSKRYPVLRGISILLKAAAVICLLVGLFHLVRFLANSQHIDLIVQLELYYAGGFIFTALISWGYADLIMVFIDSEENTRAMRQLMERGRQ